MMRRLRAIVYRLGFRPPLGSIWHSPTLAMRAEWREASRAFLAGVEAPLTEIEKARSWAEIERAAGWYATDLDDEYDEIDPPARDADARRTYDEETPR